MNKINIAYLFVLFFSYICADIELSMARERVDCIMPWPSVKLALQQEQIYEVNENISFLFTLIDETQKFVQITCKIISHNSNDQTFPIHILNVPICNGLYYTAERLIVPTGATVLFLAKKI